MSAGAVQILTLIPMFAVFYFLLIRPQQKKAKKLQAMRDNLDVGNKITTIGGIVGKITSIKEDDIDVNVNGTSLTFKKWAIASVDVD
ncbi:MAG: preprotein translocase subunit YajC [Clostridia bacterium]|nr:preprotein translocase subunit YajC [Clostridia bacterium]